MASCRVRHGILQIFQYIENTPVVGVGMHFNRSALPTNTAINGEKTAALALGA
jgi:hypothetical protein